MEKASSLCEVAGGALVRQWIIAKQPGGPSLPSSGLKMRHNKETPLFSTRGWQAGSRRLCPEF